MSKAGKNADIGPTTMGTQHPLPENIPHLASPGPAANNNGPPGSIAGSISSQGGQSGSPVKESILQRQTSVDEQATRGAEEGEDNISPPPVKEGIPIRWQN